MTNITISEETQIDLPSTRKVMGVDRNEWSRLKTMINRVTNSKGYWQNAGWFAAASALSFFLSAYTTTAGISITPPNLLSMLAVVATVAAVILFIADYALGDAREIAKQDILELMQSIEVTSTAQSETNHSPGETTSAQTTTPLESAPM
jgi:hypothetical protein